MNICLLTVDVGGLVSLMFAGYGGGMADTDILNELKTMMSSFQQDMHGLKADFAGLKTDVAGLKTDVAGLKTDVAELKTDVAVLKTDVAELKTDVAVLKTDVAEIKARQDSMQVELTAVHGLARQTARYARENRDFQMVLMEAFAAHRREYLEAHPHD